jgi:hypothetical protein
MLSELRHYPRLLPSGSTLVHASCDLWRFTLPPDTLSNIQTQFWLFHAAGTSRGAIIDPESDALNSKFKNLSNDRNH